MSEMPPAVRIVRLSNLRVWEAHYYGRTELCFTFSGAKRWIWYRRFAHRWLNAEARESRRKLKALKWTRRQK